MKIGVVSRMPIGLHTFFQLGYKDNYEVLVLSVLMLRGSGV